MRNNVFSFILFCSVLGGAGTGVGNFNTKTQHLFDFKIGYLKNWNLTATPDLVETWLLNNISGEIPSEKSSSLQIEFLKNFPAKNVDELLKEIEKLHPGEVWNSIKNPQIDGWSSVQKEIGPHRFKNFEYYFSDKGLVIKIETIRDEHKNGAVELQINLDTIRRPSRPPSIVSVKVKPKESGEPFKPGDRACYDLVLDSAKSEENLTLTSFSTQGSYDYWTLREIKWVSEESLFNVCQTITSAFPENSLWITQLGISWGMTNLYCNGTAQSLICEKNTISISYPPLHNPSLDREGPNIRKFEKSKNGEIVIEAQDSTGLEIAKVNIGERDGKSLLFFNDELASGLGIKKIPKGFLSTGFNMITSIQIFDRAGNITELKMVPGQSNYQLTRQNGTTQASEIPLISIEGAKQ